MLANKPARTMRTGGATTGSRAGAPQSPHCRTYKHLVKVGDQAAEGRVVRARLDPAANLEHVDGCLDDLVVVGPLLLGRQLHEDLAQLAAVLVLGRCARLVPTRRKISNDGAAISLAL